MNPELFKRICDYFDPDELADLLGLSTQDILWAAEEGDYLTDEAVADLEEIMKHGTV